MFIVFMMMMISCLSAQDTPIRVTPQFTCWFANYTKISDTQFEKELYLVFGYTSTSSIELVLGLTPNNPASNQNRLSPAKLPQTQVTHIFPGIHLFAFEIRVPTNTIVTWFLANISAEVPPNMLNGDRMCKLKYNRQCPGSGIHNDSSLFLGFCETTFTQFCGERSLCSAGQCNTISAPICPSGSNCNESALSCQSTPAPTASIPPTPANTIPPTPPPTINTPPPPTNTPTTLAPTIITPPPPTPSPTTARRTNSPTRAQTTRRPTPVPTPIPTSAPIGLSSPSTTSIIASVGTLVGSALVMMLIVLFAMATRNVRRK